jgi:OOP family OmpA-OmpF porin
MNKRKVFLACVGLLAMLGGSQAALAGNRAEAVTLSLNGSYYQFASKRYLDNIFLPNVGLAYNFDANWAVEANAGLINTNGNTPKFSRTTGVHGGLYTVDGIYRFAKADFIEPYVLAGLGMIALQPNGNDTKHQGNINAGLGAQLFATDSIAFRFEARDIYTMSGGKNEYQVTGGLSFLFGCNPPKAAPCYK